MKKQVLSVVALAALAMAESDAGYPFNKFQKARRPSAVQMRANKSVQSHILESPEKMTELYGPSILIREPAIKKKSKFVIQPD